MFNEYFINVGQSLMTNIASTNNTCSFTDTTLIINNDAKSFFLRSFGDIKVRNHIQEMNQTNAQENQEYLIKVTANVIAPILTKYTKHQVHF